MESDNSTKNSLAGKTVIVGITGSIAAYKMADLVSKLVKKVDDSTDGTTFEPQELLATQTDIGKRC